MKFSSKQVFGGCGYLSVSVNHQMIFLTVWMILISSAAGRHREMDPVMTIHEHYITFYPRQSYCLQLLEALEGTGGFYGQPVLCQRHKCNHYNIRGKYCASNGKILKTFHSKCHLCASGCHELNRLKPIYRVIHEGMCTENDIIGTVDTLHPTTQEPTTTLLTSTRRSDMPTTGPPSEATTDTDYSTVKHITQTTSPTEQKLTSTTNRPISTTQRPRPISTTHRPSSTTYKPGSTTQRPSSTTYRPSTTSTTRQITSIIMNTLFPFTLDFQTNVTVILTPTTTPQVPTAEDSSTTDVSENQTKPEKDFSPSMSAEGVAHADQMTSPMITMTTSLDVTDTTEGVTQNSTILTEQPNIGTTESRLSEDHPFNYALLPIKEELRETTASVLLPDKLRIRNVLGEQHCTSVRQLFNKEFQNIKFEACPFVLLPIPKLPKFL